MPIKQAGMLASRVSTWPRDHFCRSTIAPRPSRPTTWNEFLPISMPITAITLLSFSIMACSFHLAPPASLLADGRQEHGRTIPLAEIAGLVSQSPIADLGHDDLGINPRNRPLEPGATQPSVV